MMRGWIIFGVAAALPVAAMAAVPASPAPAAAVAPKVAAKTAAPLVLQPGMKRATLSAEGNAIAAKIMGAPDPRMAQIKAEALAVNQEQMRLMAGPTVDMDKLEPLLRHMEALSTEARTRKNDRVIQLLRALGDGDRMVLLQSMVNPVQPQNSKPVAPSR